MPRMTARVAGEMGGSPTTVATAATWDGEGSRERHCGRAKGGWDMDVKDKSSEKFQVDKSMLFDVIKRQAGTLSKAITEGVMNSVDAGATHCDVTLDRRSFAIRDDGRGITGRQEVMDFFKTFGRRHATEATYGRYRMGRGQMFAFGRNVWRTGTFMMEVDVGNESEETADGPGFDLTTFDGSVTGCSIEVALYKALLPADLEETLRDLRQAVAYTPIPVRLNGVVISKSADTEKWDVVKDDYRIRFRAAGPISVYNRGIFVCNEHPYQYGTGAIVVTTAKLDVIFARNQMLSTCPVWTRIRADLKAHTKRETKGKGKLTDDQRHSVIMAMLAGDLSSANLELPVLVLVNGGRLSMAKFTAAIEDRMALGVAPAKDRVGSAVHEGRHAVVLAEETMEAFQCADAAALVETLKRLTAAATKWDQHRLNRAMANASLRIVDGTAMAAMVDSDHRTIEVSDLGKGERIALDIIEAGVSEMGHVLANAVRDPDPRVRAAPRDHLGVTEGMRARLVAHAGRASWHPRTVAVGESGIADAWTNGMNRITFGRHLLPLVNEGYAGMQRLMSIALHEYLHGEPDTETHVHSPEFYELAHDIGVYTGIVGSGITKMVERGIRLASSGAKATRGAFRKHETAVAVAEDFGVPDIGRAA